MSMAPDLSIVIPCYNEQDVVEKTVNDLISYFSAQKLSYEILCVNNASKDGTEEVLKKLCRQSPLVRYVNTTQIPGYGVAVRWGLEHYSGRSVVIAMADGAESPADVYGLYKKIDEGYDCAFGSRFQGGVTVEGYPPFKMFLNRLGNFLISKVTGNSYNDFTNGFKCYRREVIDLMRPFNSQYFNLTVEMSMGAVLNGARFAVVPNSWKDRDGGVSKFAVLNQSKMYLMTVAFCWLRKKIQGNTWISFQKEVKKND